MRLPPKLDRAWTYTVWGAFIFVMPLLLIVWSQEYGAWNVVLGIAALFLLGMWRGWPSTDQPQRPPDLQ